MKIHTFVRDAHSMEINELEAINRRVRAVQATPQPDENERTEHEPAQEAEENLEVPKKARKKKKEEGI